MSEKKVIWLLVLCLFVGGCGSVPLSTMWRLRNFKTNDIVNLDPNEIKVNIQIPEESGCDPNYAYLTIEGRNFDGSTDEYEFGMQKYKSEKETYGIVFKETLLNSYFEFTDQAMDEMEKAKKVMKDKKYSSVAIGAYASISQIPESGMLELSVYIKLNKDEEFFQLIDRAEMKVKVGTGDD